MTRYLFHLNKLLSLKDFTKRYNAYNSKKILTINIILIIDVYLHSLGKGI